MLEIIYKISVVLDKENSAICNVLAIGRAKRYSPNSVDKDAAVLESVCRVLERKGITICTVSEDEPLTDNCKGYDLYVSMGRKKETLRFLEERQAEGAVVVNSPEGVALCCNRKQLNDKLKEAGIPLPPKEGAHGYWLKRACGVTENEDDVRFAATREEMEKLRGEMLAEGIGEVLVQAHVKGDLVKFYGVAGNGFYQVYYPGDDGQWKFGDERRNGVPRHYHFNQECMHDMFELAAQTAGVGVYGGDAIVRPNGSFVIIDFNDWPSFSRCLEGAANAIATHILINVYNNFVGRPKGYIFDYGGTLDTGGMHWGKALWHAYERCGVPVTEQLFRDAYVHAERTLGKNRIIMPDFTFKQTLDTKLRIEMEYIADKLLGFVVDEWHDKVLDDIYTRTLGFTADSVKQIKKLRRLHPDVGVVLVSNFYGNVETVLEEMGFKGLFDKVIESAVVGIRKPDPRIFALGVEALGLKPEECIVIGDSYDKDIVPANKIGCRTVWIKGEGWTDDEPDKCCANITLTPKVEYRASII